MAKVLNCWMARDDFGGVYIYKERPTLEPNGLYYIGDYMTPIPYEYLPNELLVALCSGPIELEVKYEIPIGVKTIKPKKV